LGNRDALQSGAALERGLLDRNHAIRNRDIGQAGAVTKKVLLIVVMPGIVTLEARAGTPIPKWSRSGIDILRLVQ
jgi:hypothetical protein